MSQMETNIYLKSFFIIIVTFFISHSSLAQKNYRVVNIDTTESYYFIEVRRCFKKDIVIVEKSDYLPKPNDERIEIGKRYELDLEPYKTAKFTPDTENYTLLIEGKVVWDSDKRYNLFSSPSILNLFYIDAKDN